MSTYTGAEPVNIALHKPATQSSYSPWSTPGEAGRAVDGLFDGPMAFQTTVEDRPWWEVDLGCIYTLEAIVVHNRLDGFTERAKTLRVNVSTDGARWTLVHAGLVAFGGQGAGGPLRLGLGGLIKGRYVRLSLQERQPLHLAQVEVFARTDLAAVEGFKQAFGIEALRLHIEDPSVYYFVEYAPDCVAPTRIVGLKINHSGRFGNIFQQYTHAVLLAQRTGLKYVQLGRHELFALKTPVEIEGITFLPHDAALPKDGAFLSGVFFDSSDFMPVLSPFMTFEPKDEIDHALVARRVFRDHLLTNVPLASDHPHDELTVHLRAGDIFRADEPTNTWYRQPPLGFYKLAVSHARETLGITRVKLVYEDEGNPCIRGLKTWLTARGLPFTVQSGALGEDLAALIDAPHVVFGHGTFGYAACRLSQAIKNVYFFAPQLGGRYELIPGVEQVHRVHDAAWLYIKGGEWGDASEGEWRNTPEQHALMLDYPEANLAMETLTGPAGWRQPALAR